LHSDPDLSQVEGAEYLIAEIESWGS
jgi:hypothetical protein